MPFFGVPIRNGLPIGLGSVAGFGAPQEFTPAELFIGGTAGTWYDPSDLTTMFTTSAGTTPVSMPGQGSAVSVGLMLDKSQGATPGPELVTNGDFSSGTTGWSVSAAGTSTLTASVVSGAARLVYNYTGSAAQFYQAISVTAGKFYRITTAASAVSGTVNANISVRSTSDAGTSVNLGFQTINASGTTNVSFYYYATSTTTVYLCAYFYTSSSTVDVDNISVRELPGNHAIAINDSTARPELRARVNLLVATATLSTQSVTTQATSYTLRFAGTGSITLSGTATGTYSAGTHTITCTAGTLTLTVSGTVTTADLRPANSGALLPAYQAVTDANTYDTAGFPLYLRFDGIDDGMYTPANLNLSATDKATVFAGVRALQSAVQVISELSANTNSNNGSFVLYKNNDGLGFASRGTGLVDVNNGSGFAPPISLVLTGQSNITAPSLSLRSNGTQILSSTSSQGTGNFGTYPLYIGSRGNSSVWFPGHLHGLIVVGSAVSAGNISATESWMAGKTGIVI